jgi:hypothetical protein
VARKMLTNLDCFYVLIGVFYVFFTDSITGKDSDDLVLLSDLCVGEISFRVLLGYNTDDCDG